MLGEMPRRNRLQLFRFIICVVYGALQTCAVIVDQPGQQINAGNSGALVNTAATQLLECYNANASKAPSTFSEFLSAKPTRSLRLHRIWWSDRHAGFSMTVFTQIDLSRMRVLEQQCRSFPGGILSAAVWVPLVQPPNNGTLTQRSQDDLQNATRIADGLFQKMEGLNRALQQDGGTNSSSTGAVPPKFAVCSLRLLLVMEPVSDEALTLMMPINALRNVAMLAADTPLAAMIDVDLSISQGLAGSLLANKTRAEEIVRRSEAEGILWVMPAWDTNKTLGYHGRCSMVDQVIGMRPPEKMTRLKEAWLQRVDVFPFAFDRFLPGHNTTDYWRWIDSPTEYAVTYTKGYEPWYITARKNMVQYDARFRGYYFNKLLNVRYNALCLKKKFWVLPEVWLVHRHHDVIVSSNVWYKTRKKKQEALSDIFDKPMYANGTTIREMFYETSKGWYDVTYHRTEIGTYVPVVDEASTYCRKVLPWWQWN